MDFLRSRQKRVWCCQSVGFDGARMEIRVSATQAKELQSGINAATGELDAKGVDIRPSYPRSARMSIRRRIVIRKVPPKNQSLLRCEFLDVLSSPVNGYRLKL